MIDRNQEHNITMRDVEDRLNSHKIVFFVPTIIRTVHYDICEYTNSQKKIYTNYFFFFFCQHQHLTVSE